MELKVDYPFLINESDETLTLKLQAQKRKVLYVTLNMGRHILEDPEKFKFERREGNYLEMRGHLRAAESVGQQLECAAKILLPQVLVSTKHFDFGTGYIGDTFKVRYELSNLKGALETVTFSEFPDSFLKVLLSTPYEIVTSFSLRLLLSY